MNSTREKVNGPVFVAQLPTRKNSGSASATMRKYQQLALAIVSLISLMAFLFYKHEYDRLHYTLEYLEMFGNVPTDVGSSAVCGGSLLRKFNSAPHTWVKLSNDIAIYSVFWDEGNGLVNPLIRATAAVKKSNEQHMELSSSLLFESGEITVDATCSIEEILLRNYGKALQVNEDPRIVNVVCRSDNYNRKVPYLLQFKIGKDWTLPLFVQESESWKSVSNSSCVCLYSPEFPVTSLKLVEFIAYYSILGVEKFVFYGSLLTPVVRKLLDKYGDESNIFFEEKSFLIPEGFFLDDVKMRALIENDCVYRHRDRYENVLVLNLNEYLIPRNKNSLQEILTSVGGKSTVTASEFHFVSQSVCVDQKHSKTSELLLSSQIRTLANNNDEKLIALLRPHLIDISINLRTGSPGVYHVPSSVASIYSFDTCSDANHMESDHLPSVMKFVEWIKKSLLYRKWKINS